MSNLQIGKVNLANRKSQFGQFGFNNLAKVEFAKRKSELGEILKHLVFNLAKTTFWLHDVTIKAMD
jgi:hypothetical protein